MAYKTQKEKIVQYLDNLLDLMTFVEDDELEYLILDYKQFLIRSSLDLGVSSNKIEDVIKDYINLDIFEIITYEKTLNLPESKKLKISDRLFNQRKEDFENKKRVIKNEVNHILK